MRREFVAALVAEAQADERVVLLTGDLGFGALEPFAEAFPDRFFNAGAAEQNMVGMATGLAQAGLTPYVYSIATFASMRPYEFIRNGAVVHGLPIRIVGTGPGLDYDHNGITHYALEDVALMRAQPGLAVVAPGSSDQIGAVVKAVQQLPGPAYLRVSKRTIMIPELADQFTFGRANQLIHGHDVALIAMGGMSELALGTADLLAGSGVSASVTVVASVSPPPVDDLVALLASHSLVLTIEAHYITGGLGSLVAEIIADHRIDCQLIRAGVRELPLGIVGSYGYMYEKIGLTAASLAQTVNGALVGSEV